MRPLILTLFLLATVACATGCAAPYEITTPDGMAEVTTDSRAERYDYRAMTPRGVVLGVRVIPQGGRGEVPAAGADFWTEAVRQRMRTLGGYALLGEDAVTSADGTRGTRFRFGRDQRGATYMYWITLYVTDENIHVIDVAARQERFEEAQEIIEQALSSYVVRD